MTARIFLPGSFSMLRHKSSHASSELNWACLQGWQLDVGSSWPRFGSWLHCPEPLTEPFSFLCLMGFPHLIKQGWHNELSQGYNEKQMRPCVGKALARSDLWTNISQHSIVAGANRWVTEITAGKLDGSLPSGFKYECSFFLLARKDMISDNNHPLSIIFFHNLSPSCNTKQHQFLISSFIPRIVP